MSVFTDIKNKVSIKEVCESYLSFNDSGFALSPFSDEKSASFTYSTKLNIAKDFGRSGWSGDCIKFVADIEKCSMLDAAKIINDKFNLGVIFTQDQDNKVYQLNEELAKSYHSQLTPEAVNYLISRGITNDSIKSFLLGYDNGRVTFPLRNRGGKTVGFNKRLIEHHENLPKYIHSATSDIFKKSEFVCHLDKALTLKSSYVILTEGQIETVLAYQKGLSCCCLLSGNISEEQAKKINQYYNKIVLAYDNDPTGLRATVDSFKIFKVVNKTIKISAYKFSAHDYADALCSNTNIVEIDCVDYLLERNLDYTTWVQILSVLTDAVELDVYCKVVAKKLDIRYESLFYEVRKNQGILTYTAYQRGVIPLV